MKNRKITVSATALMLSALTTGQALAGSWVSDGANWRYLKDDGSYSMSAWVEDNGSYYMTDANGIMMTGWYQDMADGGRWYYLQPEEGAPKGSMKTGWLLKDGKWYFLDTRIGGPRGGMLTGWQCIDGKCYYLDPADGGAMAVSKTTPDGYRVDESGAWVDESGNQYFEAGKGISSTQTVDIAGRTAGPGGSISGQTGTLYYTGGGSGGSGGGSGSSGSSGRGSSESRDNSVSYAANDFKQGNYSKMSADERADVADAIADFKEEYITDGMSDFEKEIKIIEWLVENCEYQKADDWENGTAYSCIVNGEAQCSGYADAFLQTAKACGLEARYVYNKQHAWNLVKLDGDWYHVDVTWEDPIGSNNYGFGNLRNEYINLEDSEIRTFSSHHEWSPTSTKADGVKYGPKAVANYMKTGEVETGLDSSFEERSDAIYESADMVIDYTGSAEAAEEVIEYLRERIDKRESSYNVIVKYPAKYDGSVTKDSLKIYDLNDEIEEIVNQKINSEYKDILRWEFNFLLTKGTDASKRMYGQGDGRLSYSEGKGKKYDYCFNFIDSETDEIIETQEGKAENRETISAEIPEGYQQIYPAADNCEVLKGKAQYTGLTVIMLQEGDIELDITVQKKESRKAAEVSEVEKISEDKEEPESEEA